MTRRKPGLQLVRLLRELANEVAPLFRIVPQFVEFFAGPAQTVILLDHPQVPLSVGGHFPASGGDIGEVPRLVNRQFHCLKQDFIEMFSGRVERG